MTTIRQICTSALKRIREVAGGQDPSATDMDLAVSLYNQMLTGWAAQGVNLEHQPAGINDDFHLFVPPRTLDGQTLEELAYQGTWNASTNTPTLTSAAGTRGYLYRVSTSGSTTLDTVTSWTAGDYAVFDGTAWNKSRSSARHEQAIVDLLAERLAEDFGHELSQRQFKAARDGWIGLQAEFIRVDGAVFDNGLVRTPSRRFWGTLN